MMIVWSENYFYKLFSSAYAHQYHLVRVGWVNVSEKTFSLVGNGRIVMLRRFFINEFCLYDRMAESAWAGLLNEDIPQPLSGGMILKIGNKWDVDGLIKPIKKDTDKYHIKLMSVYVRFGLYRCLFDFRGVKPFKLTGQKAKRYLDFSLVEEYYDHTGLVDL